MREIKPANSNGPRPKTVRPKGKLTLNERGKGFFIGVGTTVVTGIIILSVYIAGAAIVRNAPTWWENITQNFSTPVIAQQEMPGVRIPHTLEEDTYITIIGPDGEPMEILMPAGQQIQVEVAHEHANELIANTHTIDFEPAHRWQAIDHFGMSVLRDATRIDITAMDEEEINQLSSRDYAIARNLERINNNYTTLFREIHRLRYNLEEMTSGSAHFFYTDAQRESLSQEIEWLYNDILERLRSDFPAYQFGTHFVIPPTAIIEEITPRLGTQLGY